MGYTLGKTSFSHLTNVHPRLVKVVQNAILITTQDFTVFEGLRSIEDEKKNIKNGESKLKDPKDCMHCVQGTGFGHAVDLVPYVDGKVSWDWQYVYPIALAMKNAAKTSSIMLRWGGVWDKRLNDLSDDMKKEVDLYKARHPGPDFLDGVHFEIHKSDLVYTGLHRDAIS